MGIGLGYRCSSSPYAVPNSNPNPSNFKIEYIDRRGNYAIVIALYPDAKNYEGRKIMVYDMFGRPPFPEVIGDKLDPHFAEEGFCPIARFKPTKEGLLMAIQFIKMMTKQDKR